MRPQLKAGMNGRYHNAKQRLLFIETIAGGAIEMAVAKKVWTDEEILRLKCEGKVEVVDGELKVMTPAGLEQEDGEAILVAHLVNYVISRKLGRVYMSQAGFRMPSGSLRAPDVSFVLTEKLPEDRSTKKFGQFPPNLEVEILAEDETLSGYDAKVRV